MNQLKWRNAKRILALAVVAGIGAGAFRLAVRKQEELPECSVGIVGAAVMSRPTAAVTFSQQNWYAPAVEGSSARKCGILLPNTVV